MKDLALGHSLSNSHPDPFAVHTLRCNTLLASYLVAAFSLKLFSLAFLLHKIVGSDVRREDVEKNVKLSIWT